MRGGTASSLPMGGGRMARKTRAASEIRRGSRHPSCGGDDETTIRPIPEWPVRLPGIRSLARVRGRPADAKASFIRATSKYPTMLEMIVPRVRGGCAAN
jgi:hypothetical protein